LLEVVVALVLFVTAATIIGSGMSASVDEVERLRLNVQGDNLAATILAELQMGLQPLESSGPITFDPPFDKWTWQTVVETLEDPSAGTGALQRVEVTIRNQSSAVVCRLTQLLPEVALASTDTGLADTPKDSRDTASAPDAAASSMP
jgi:type II secretory pathway pseudopilin PulG